MQTPCAFNTSVVAMAATIKKHLLTIDTEQEMHNLQAKIRSKQTV